MDPAVPDNENQFVHELYAEVSHKFIITCRYRVRNIDETLFDQAQQDIEDMCVEVVRILKTVYDPMAGTGSFFTARYGWQNTDNLTGKKQELKRTLTFELSEIQSKSTEVYRGAQGVLTFDLSMTNNDPTPAPGDYIYTEANNVTIREGTTVIEALSKDTANGARVPRLGSGTFRGTFRADIFAKRSDIGTTAEKLNSIYILQANGQHIEAAFLHDVDNTESTALTLSQTSFVKVTSMEKRSTPETLVSFHVEGRLIKPSTFVAEAPAG